jgi:RimJ/RimL family protein N-acetyltransferase
LENKLISWRTANEQDLQQILNIRNSNREFLHNNQEFSLDDITELFAVSENFPFHPIVLDDSIIGYFRLTYDWSNHHLLAGMDLDPEYQNAGIGTALYESLIEEVLEDGSIHKIWLEVLSNNYRAIHVYSKLGFMVEGIRQDHLYRDGKYIDSIIMSIIKDAK